MRRKTTQLFPRAASFLRRRVIQEVVLFAFDELGRSRLSRMMRQEIGAGQDEPEMDCNICK